MQPFLSNIFFSYNCGVFYFFFSKQNLVVFQVKFSPIFSYMKSVGFFWTTIIIVTQILNISVNSFSLIWLTEWSKDGSRPPSNSSFTVMERLGVYSGIGFSYCKHTFCLVPETGCQMLNVIYPLVQV